MHSIHSKWRKPKPRGSKAKAAKRNIAKRYATKNTGQEEVGNDPAANLQSQPGPSSTTPSTSSRKMDYFATSASETLMSLPDFLLIHKEFWNDFFKSSVCANCKAGQLSASFKEKHGFVRKIVLTCSICERETFSSYTSPRVAQTEDESSTRPPFLCNRKIVDAFLDIGTGHAGLQRFSAAMSMDSLSIHAYMKHLEKLATENERVKTEVLELARQAVRKAHELENSQLQGQEIIDIEVSFDGSWPTRGHSSLVGVVSVIDILTGLVVDFHVLCKYCHVCAVRGIELGSDSHEFKMWQKNHQDVGECDVNYNGSAPAMEMFGAEVLWRRSVSKNKMRYTTILSDGDSKTVGHLNGLKPYGPNIIITKEECLNHLSKRVGTALRKLVSDEKARGVTLGGRKEGALKDTTIVKLQSYYHKAIKENMPHISVAQKAIMATLDHLHSTDKKPNHRKCLKGKTSWCFYNRAKAMRVKSKSHSEMSFSINDLVYEKVKPVYERLSANELLSRCTRLSTQNANESLHSVMWGKCKKETFLSYKRYELGITRGVGEFNMGLCKMLHLRACDQNKGEESLGTEHAQKIDRKRKLQSQSQEKKTVKRAKKKLHKKKGDSQMKKKEGVTYQAGAF